MGSLLGAIIGGVLGYAAGFSLLVDEIGRIGHRLFWEATLNGRLGSKGIQEALESETFWQVFVPAVIGIIVGGIVGAKLSGSGKTPHQPGQGP